MLKTVEKQTRKPGLPNPMTPAAKAEHAIVAQALQNVIGPRLKPEVRYGADACIPPHRVRFSTQALEHNTP